ncbi:hypothetical protein Dimus_007430 [Dionaea muscipula]
MAEQAAIGSNGDGRSRQQRQEVGLEFFFPLLSLPPLLCFPMCLVAMEAGQITVARHLRLSFASGVLPLVTLVNHSRQSLQGGDMQLNLVQHTNENRFRKATLKQEVVNSFKVA